MAVRRVRLKSAKGARSYIYSVRNRIHRLNAFRKRHSIFQLRRSSRTRKSGNVENVMPLRIVQGDESGLQVYNFGPTKGRGVVASRVFAKEEAILEYCGNLLPKKEGIRREQLYAEDVGSYMFYFVHKGRGYCIDASEETHHLGRLVNHSKRHPNAYIKVMLKSSGTLTLVLFASRNIEVGEEILYNYGENRPHVLAMFPWLKD